MPEQGDTVPVEFKKEKEERNGMASEKNLCSQEEKEYFNKSVGARGKFIASGETDLSFMATSLTSGCEHMWQ